MVACVRFRYNLKINRFQGSWKSMITKFLIKSQLKLKITFEFVTSVIMKT